jgi:hypothetical protein
MLDNLTGQRERDEAFAEWMAEQHSDLDSFLVSSLGLTVEQGGLVFREYAIVNNSDISVFFRISRAEVLAAHDGQTVPAGLEAAVSARWGLLSDSGSGGMLLSGEDGFFYYTEPLEAGDTIVVTFFAFIDVVEHQTEFILSSSVAEVIQTANNAIHLHGGWDILSAILMEEQGEP